MSPASLADDEPFWSYRYVRGECSDCNGIAWVPDIPCEHACHKSGPDPFAAYTAGVVRARDAYAADPTHDWCARGCFNLARVGAYCCDYCRDTRPHRRREA